MIQPSKDKKKPNGTPVAGTTNSKREIELEQKEFASREKQRKELKDPKNKEFIESQSGIKRNPETKEWESKKYEKVYFKGDPSKRTPSEVRDGKGKLIKSVRAGSSEDEKMKKEYDKAKKDTETRRENNQDHTNFIESGKKGQAYVRRQDKQEAFDEGQAKLRDDKMLAQAQLDAHKRKKGQ